MNDSIRMVLRYMGIHTDDVESIEDSDFHQMRLDRLFYVPLSSDSEPRSTRAAVSEFMETKYPDFDPEIVYSATGKDYFLPALKVLVVSNGQYVSPVKMSVWKDMRMDARCIRIVGDVEVLHDCPNEECTCGIYGSVNVEEISHYLHMFGSLDFSIYEKRLCIIEPEEDADVILCRKGWKASSAFISEIIGETISEDDASRLLSVAWKRAIDVKGCLR